MGGAEERKRASLLEKKRTSKTENKDLFGKKENHKSAVSWNSELRGWN